MLLDPYHRGVQYGIRTFIARQSAKRSLASPTIQTVKDVAQVLPNLPKKTPIEVGLKLVHDFFRPNPVTVTTLATVKGHSKGLAGILYLFKRV